MLSLSDIYFYINTVANKSQTGGSFSPDQFNSLANVCQLSVLKQKCGLPEEYQPGNPIPRQQFEQSKANSDSLGPFKVFMAYPNDPLMIDANGMAQIPKDYFYDSSMLFQWVINKPNCKTIIKQRPVDLCTDAKWNYLIDHSFKFPTYRDPIANYQAGFIRFAPKDMAKVDYVYIRYPKTPFYDFYIHTDLEHIYLPQGTSHVLAPGEQGSAGQTSGTVVSLSQELEGNETWRIEVAMLILSKLGINIREQELFAAADKQIKEGI